MANDLLDQLAQSYVNAIVTGQREPNYLNVPYYLRPPAEALNQNALTEGTISNASWLDFNPMARSAIDTFMEASGAAPSARLVDRLVKAPSPVLRPQPGETRRLDLQMLSPFGLPPSVGGIGVNVPAWADDVAGVANDLVQTGLAGADLAALAPIVGRRAANSLMNELGQVRMLPKGGGGILSKTKVVDESGKPLTVFHASDQVFDEFDTKMLGSNTGAASAKQGFFFTNSSRAASYYPIYDPNMLIREGGFILKRPPRPAVSQTELELKKKMSDLQEQSREIAKQGWTERERLSTITESRLKGQEQWPIEEINKLDEAVEPFFKKSKSLRDEVYKIEKQIKELPENVKYRNELEAAKKKAEEDNILAIGERSRKQVESIVKEAKKLWRDKTITEDEFYTFEEALRRGSEFKYSPPAALKQLHSDAMPHVKKVEDAFDWSYKYNYSKQRWSGGDPNSGEVWEADRENVAPNIRPVYLNIENPYVYDQAGGYRDQKYVDIIKKAKSLGHDGVIIKNTRDPIFMDVYVAFKPEQIVSKFSGGVVEDLLKNQQ